MEFLLVIKTIKILFHGPGGISGSVTVVLYISRSRMRNENTSSRYDSRKLRDPQRNTGKYIYRHIKVEYVICSYS